MRTRRPAAAVLSACLLLLAGGCADLHRCPRLHHAPTNPLVGPPEVLAVSSPGGAVAACSIEAARVGTRVLAEGGNAVDAAVATVLALGATDPASLGLGAEIVMTIHTSAGENIAVEDPSFVPLRVRPGELVAVQKAKRRWGDSWGRIGTTVPTGLAVLGTALERYGTRSFANLVEPAAGLALRGYPLGRYQRAVIGIHRPGILECPEMAAIFLGPDGEVPQAGTVVGRNPDLARTLRRLGRRGWRDFYTGDIAREIEEDMLSHGGWVSRTDLARALGAVRILTPLEIPYRDRTVIVPDDPSGGPTLALGLGIVSRFPLPILQRDTVDRLHLIVEAFRLAAFARAAGGNRTGPSWRPFEERTDPSAELAGLIRFGRVVPLEEAADTLVPGLGSHTTHVSVMDRAGNAVSVTGSLGRFFGTKAVTPGLGFPFNILMTAFQFEDRRRPGYGRPLAIVRSEVTPAIVLRNGRSELVLGTGGSARIPSILFNVLSNVVDRGMDLRSAVAFPRVAWNGGAERMIYLEIRPPVGPGVADALRRRGFEHVLEISYPATTTNRGLLGGVHAVAFDPATGLFTGVGDPRRDGAASGVPTPPGQDRSER